MNRVFFCFWFIQNELDFPTVQFHRASCLILRNKSTQNSQAGCWPEEVEVPRGESLGVRCHKNTTSSVGSCGASGAFLSSPQSCPLLLPVSLTQPVCLPASLLSVSLHSHNTKLCLSSAEPTALRASVSALREKTLFMQRKPPLHMGMLTALIPRRVDTK